ncbi:MAG: DinB family protein [Anaerolineae bacterium]
MDSLQYFQRLFDYNYWMNRTIWEKCVLPLTDEQYTQYNDYSKGSVHRQLVHMMAVEQLWLSRLHGVNPNALPKPDEYPTRDLLRARWDKVERDWRTYLHGLTEADLQRYIEYQYIVKAGEITEQRHMLLWEILVQTVNHGTDHRAQLLAAIHRAGGATLEQDYTLFATANAAGV